MPRPALYLELGTIQTLQQPTASRTDPPDPAEVKGKLAFSQGLLTDPLEPPSPGVKDPALDSQPYASGIICPEVDDEYLSCQCADGVGRPVGLGLPDDQSEILIRAAIEPSRPPGHAIGVEQKEANYK